MSFEQLLFYGLSALLLLAATLVVTVRNPVHAALFLVLAFFASAGVWLLLEAEFLAITLVLVYVGAVMVLFLFVVMMLDINISVLREGFSRYLPVGLLVLLLMVALLLSVVGGEPFGLERYAAPAPLPADANNTRTLGLLLYTAYVYPFEIAAVILLVAIIAAIALTLRRRGGTRYQSVSQQVAVERSARVRLVEMSSEPTK